MRYCRFLVAAACAVESSVFAFDLPEAEAEGIKVEIRDLDQLKRSDSGCADATYGLTVVTSGVGRAFDVRVTNKGSASVRGRFACTFNDADWSVTPAEPEDIELEPGAVRTFRRTLVTTGRPVRGIYPVHAVFEPAERAADKVDAVGFFFSQTTNRPFFYAGPKPKIPGKRSAPAVPPTDENTWAQRTEEALVAAKGAVAAPDPKHGLFRLDSGREVIGAAVVPGKRGLLDGVIAFVSGERQVAIRGFDVCVDGRRVPAEGAGLVDVRISADEEGLSIVHCVDFDYLRENVPLRVAFHAERGGLRVQWDVPGVVRQRNGTPSYTRLAVGPASAAIERVYAGCGNVIERPKAFTLKKGGFSLSTRHIGVDYAGELSLVTAVGIHQDCLECRPEENFCSVITHNDALFTLVPSAKGAFAAARNFADISGYRKGPGVDTINGTFSMDNGPADYQRTAWAMDEAARYGITNGVFVKHHWQRYGYDVRLPDIYPPRGDITAFMNMVAATKRAGIRFCPHDNYTDFYADAEGYTFDRIRFFPDGTAWLAWGFYPGGRRVQSYKWLPTASLPFSRRNYRLMRDGFAPDGLFVDVLGANVPDDCYDRTGRFLPANVMYESFCRTFDVFREETGQPDAPTISEAGCDNLVGHLDAGETDHFAANRNYDWLKREQYADAQRVPWHDIVTHGKFVMLGGGLGLRYSGYDMSGNYHDDVRHGYGSDDYLATTVLGGRTPAAGGPCDRRTVLTAWMIGDVCSRLAKETFESFRFDGTIHRQQATFSGGGEVWVNRETNRLWTVAGGKTLGRDGFYARIGESEAGATVADGVTFGFAGRPGVVFLDARAPSGNGNAAALAECEPVGRLPSDDPRRLRLNTRWTFDRSPKGAKLYVHAVPHGRESPVLANGWFESPLPESGTWPMQVECALSLPIGDSIKTNDFDVIWGASGEDCRYPFAGRNSPAYAGCVRAGRVHVQRKEGRIVGLVWTKYDPEAEAASWALNVARRPVAYRGIETDGALRLEYGPRPGFVARLAGARPASWRLTPLPGSLPFTTKIDLAAFSAAGATVAAVKAVGPQKLGATAPTWRQDGDRIEIAVDGRSFAYEIQFESDVVSVSDFGHDERDATRILQRALDSGAKTVRIDKAGSPWQTGPLVVRSNTEIVFEDGVELQARKGLFRDPWDSLLNVNQATNVVIRGEGSGGTVRMRKLDYRLPPYEKEEHRHALNILSASDIRVEKMSFVASGGDGIYIGEDKVVSNCCRRVVIRDCVCDDNHRQGISVISVDGLLIERTVMKNTDGTDPQSGLDIEPNNPKNVLRDIVLRDCVTTNNTGNGYLIAVCHLATNSVPVSVTLENCQSLGDNLSPILHAFDPATRGKGAPSGGFLKVRGGRFAGSNRWGVETIDKQLGKMDFSFEDCVFEDNARSCPEESEFKLVSRHPGLPPTDGISFRNVRVIRRRPMHPDWLSLTRGAKTVGLKGSVTVRVDGVERPVTFDAAFFDKLRRVPVVPPTRGPTDYYVDPAHGGDNNLGLSPQTAFATLGTALSVLRPGDTLHLARGATFQGPLTVPASGTAGRPIVIDGHGATVTCRRPVPENGWIEQGDGLWLSRNGAFWGACRPRVLDAEKRLVSVAVTHPAFKDPTRLAVGVAVWNKDGIWFRPDPGRSPASYGLVGFYGFCGVIIENKSYVTIRNLVCENASNDGFNIHGTCRGLVFENVEARWNGDDGFSIHDDVQVTVNGLYSHHNDYGIQDVGGSQSVYNGVRAESNRLNGVDFCGGLRILRDSDVCWNGRTQIALNPSHSEHKARPADDMYAGAIYLESVRTTGGNTALSVMPDVRVSARDCTFAETELGYDLRGGRVFMDGCRLQNVKTPVRCAKDAKWTVADR